VGFKKQTIADIDVSGKTILLRADYNVPLEGGKITDDYRIEKSLPTINALLKQKCRLVICSHLGRPKGKPNLEYSLKPVANRLQELLRGAKVEFADDCVGPESRKKIKDLKTGNILLLENLRFHEGEESNDSDFAKKLAEGIDIFVQDGFGVVHRAHASTEAITHFLPSVAGLLVEQEVSVITGVMEKPDTPLLALIGGAKIADKIDLLNRFIDLADIVAVGGAMANTFLLAKGIEVGESLAEVDEIELAREILKRADKKASKQKFVFYVPQDGVVAERIDSKTRTRIVDWSAQVIADIENYPKRPPRNASRVAAHEKILDIGPFSGAFIAGSMQLAHTVIWNGAMGVTEVKPLITDTGPFSQGTELVVEAMLGQSGNRPKTIVGGGDTVGYIEERGLTAHFDHVSTGGGASMELMSGKKLPGVEALDDKKPKK